MKDGWDLCRKAQSDYERSVYGKSLAANVSSQVRHPFPFFFFFTPRHMERICEERIRSFAKCRFHLHSAKTSVILKKKEVRKCRKLCRVICAGSYWHWRLYGRCLEKQRIKYKMFMPVLKLSCDNVLLVVVVEEKWKQKINQKHGKNVENCVCWKNQPALFTTLTIHNDKPMIARWVPIATPAAEQTPGTWTNHEMGCG